MHYDLFQAIRYNESIDSIFQHLSDINIKNEYAQSLLHEAIAYNNNEIGIKLIEAGIDVNSQDNKGQTPLHYAAIYKNIMLGRLILENGGDISIADAYGNTPLWTAVFNARGDYLLLKIFTAFASPLIVNKKNQNGKSPLDFAMQINDAVIIEMLSHIKGSQDSGLS